MSSELPDLDGPEGETSKEMVSPQPANKGIEMQPILSPPEAHSSISTPMNGNTPNPTDDEASDENSESKKISFLNGYASINYDEILSAKRLTESIAIPITAVTLPPIKGRRRSIIRRRSTLVKHGGAIDDDEDEVHHRELVLKIRKIIGQLLQRLQKDLEVDESITTEAEKAFFTLDGSDALGSSVDNLRETIEGIRYKSEGAEMEQNWITTVCSLPMLKRSHVGIARLRNPLNLGSTNEEVEFVIAVIAPKKQKFTKNAVEIGRTFSTLMMDSTFRHKIHIAPTEEAFREEFLHQLHKFKCESIASRMTEEEVLADQLEEYRCSEIGRGVIDDFNRRIPHYLSDYADGFVGTGTIQKLISTVFFLYFACLLPAITFGTVYEKNTHDVIGVKSCIVSQVVGGMIFAFIGGQPMLILVTTPPLALFVKGIKLISVSFNIDFRAMYAMTGLWNSIFLILQAFFNMSKFMKYSTRSTEEIFDIFIALAFGADAVKATIANFKKNYHFRNENVSGLIFNTSSENSTLAHLSSHPDGCISEDFCYRPEKSILFLFLMLATLWVGFTLLRFDESQLLSSTKRAMLVDYSLPIAVICISFVGSFFFSMIKSEIFDDLAGIPSFVFPDIQSLPTSAHLSAVGLGFSLSCLFYVDQNIAAAAINAPKNKLKKGPAYHWDLLVVGFLNIPFSFFALPWVHGAVPHSPLHLKALADVEKHVTNVGTVYNEIVHVRETRLTTIFSHILIGLSLLIIPVLQYVPVAVLQGVFLYLCFSSFPGNQMYDRMALVFTEGSSYPPNHYVRKVPQKKLHLFTAFQVIQLIIVAVFGFVDIIFMKMLFPIVFLLLLPIRHKVLPKIIGENYLDVLDS